jgi:hypothetical protein
VCEGGISSEQAMCGRVHLDGRDALDENLGLVIEVQVRVLLEIMFCFCKNKYKTSSSTRLMSESTSSGTESLDLM